MRNGTWAKKKTTERERKKNLVFQNNQNGLQTQEDLKI